MGMVSTPIHVLLQHLLSLDYEINTILLLNLWNVFQTAVSVNSRTGEISIRNGFMAEQLQILKKRREIALDNSRKAKEIKKPAKHQPMI
jgi:hypothetical protein